MAEEVFVESCKMSLRGVYSYRPEKFYEEPLISPGNECVEDPSNVYLWSQA